MKAKTVRVAVVQAAPIIMDCKATIAKMKDLALESSKLGAQMILFPEAFVPAYPRGLTFGRVGLRTDDNRNDWHRYWENSIMIPSDDISEISQIAKQANAYLVVGIVEKDSESSKGTLYCTSVYFAPDGSYIGKHRKTKPTGNERVIWGEGDGSTLTVFDSLYGKIGGLICWENLMPLARTALYMKGVEIYVAPTADFRDSWQTIIRHIAMEGRCFVLGCNQYYEKNMYPKDLSCYNELSDLPEVICRGGSAIVNPFGEYVVEPVFDKEDILVADLDLNLVSKSKFDFDAVGHYSRPDIFKLVVNEDKQS